MCAVRLCGCTAQATPAEWACSKGFESGRWATAARAATAAVATRPRVHCTLNAQEAEASGRRERGVPHLEPSVDVALRRVAKMYYRVE